MTTPRVQDVALNRPAAVSVALREKATVLFSNHVDEFPGLLRPIWIDRPATHVFLVVAQGEPIGLVSWTGPHDEADPAWWIRPSCRGVGIGSRAVRMLASEMRREGVIGIRRSVTIQCPGDDPSMRESSKALVRILRQLVDQD